MFNRILSSLILLSIILSACNTTPAPTSTPATIATNVPSPTATPQGEEPLYLSIVWHHHQPLYYQDPATGIYTRPWVRVHATKDYFDMASTVAKYPNVHVTFNLTPVLIRQLDDFAAGAKDIYWTTAEKPADQLSDDDKRFILQRFFDTNPKIVARFPRYQALADKRKSAGPEAIDAALQSFTTQDFRDLQVLFNLAWFDPDFLAQEPLKLLVAKGSNFAESDKQPIFDKALEVIKQVIPEYKNLQDKGQIEVITTPYAHPILPLLYDTNLEKVGNTEAVMPDRYSFPNDAIAQLKKSVEIYQAHYGRAPRGLWPGEGAVAQEIVKMVGDAGYQWMATGEDVLAKSLGLNGFTRDSKDTVQEADQLYQPYVVENKQFGVKVNMIFRDLRLSDLIGFEYSQTPGKQAADDLMQRLENIRQGLKKENATGPHLVSIILDGENAWENYDNDGKDFLNALYQNLSDSKTVKAVTPTEYFTLHPPTQKIDQLFPGAWFSANYDTWIGEEEEATAWNYLLKTRETLYDYDVSKKKSIAPDKLARALDFMYLAEGSDWFWWYGADQNSGDDAYFDRGYRALLAEVYKSLDLNVPEFVQVPIVSANVATPSQQPNGLISPTIDGKVSSDAEWKSAGAYVAAGGAQARSADVASAFYYGLDAKNISFRVDAKSDWKSIGNASIGFYLAQPKVKNKSAFTLFSANQATKNVLGFQATHLLQIDLKNGVVSGAKLYTSDGQNGWEETSPHPKVFTASGGSILEAALPLSTFTDFETGDTFNLVAVVSQDQHDLQSIPSAGLAQVVIPDLGTTQMVLSVDDPVGDDHGSGKYTYPTDGVFKPGVFDIKHFEVGYDDKHLAFKITFAGPIPNPWGSPNNLAVQTLDVYIDKDPGAGTGARKLLPGRNASLPKGDGWDVAVWAEGWTPGVFTPDADGNPKHVDNLDFKVLVDAGQQQVTLRVPLSVFGDNFDPTKAGYTVMVMSQDGFPAPGVWRIRDVDPTASQWRLGGSSGDINHTRIIDLVQPVEAKPTQEEALSKYASAVSGDLDQLTPDDFALVPVLT
ncbi:MAG TPA: glucodextranase DOMON-like domain-containing protein, partial [Anaerolineae bacterium]|nr:glucodextranase DOMON-like domain-containing protein [Anaerolineae bacterium]